MIFFFLALSQNISSQHIDNNRDKVKDSLYDATIQQISEYKYAEAINSASLLINTSKKDSDDINSFYGYNLLSEIYDKINDSVQPIYYSRQALKHALKTGDKSIMAGAYNNLASTLDETGTEIDEALELYTKALEIERSLQDSVFLNPALNIAELYLIKKDYDRMAAYLLEAEFSLKRARDEYDDPQIYLDMLWGDYHFAKGQKIEALKLYDNAFTGIERDSLTYLAVEFYPQFIKRLIENNAPEKANVVYAALLKHIKKSHETSEQHKIFRASVLAQQEELKRMRNENFLKQEIARTSLESRQILNFLFVVILVFLVIFLLSLFRNIKTRQKLINDLQHKNRELEEAKEVAEKSVRDKTRFFSTVSHEIRTPLYGVTGVISLLDDREDKRLSREEMSSLKFSSQHLLGIINDLLDISKLEGQEFILQNRAFDLSHLLREIFSAFEQGETEHNNTFHLDIKEGTPQFVKGDPKRLSQILFNLIGNANKFTYNGDIWISLRAEAIAENWNEIYFEVKDTGEGIDQFSQRKIFQEFSQLETSNTDLKSIGTGLGLAIVTKILKKMDSAIELKSEKGKGSTFGFRLNMKQVSVKEVLRLEKDNNMDLFEKYKDFLKGKRILVIDDNAINLMVTKKVLMGKGIVVTTVKSGEEAVEKVKHNTYDLVLTDINMPAGIDGFETSVRIRKHHPGVPIIALSAAETKELQKKVKEFGLQDLIAKPYNQKELFSKLIASFQKTGKVLA